MVGMTENGSRLKTSLGVIFIVLFLIYIFANGVQMLQQSLVMGIKSLKIWLAKRKRKVASEAVKGFLKESKIVKLRKLKHAQRLISEPELSEKSSSVEDEILRLSDSEEHGSQRDME